MLAGNEIGEKALLRQKFLVGAVLRDAAPVLSAGLLILVFIPKAGPPRLGSGRLPAFFLFLVHIALFLKFLIPFVLILRRGPEPGPALRTFHDLFPEPGSADRAFAFIL